MEDDGEDDNKDQDPERDEHNWPAEKAPSPDTWCLLCLT
jgi:hypothetical protein